MYRAAVTTANKYNSSRW